MLEPKVTKNITTRKKAIIFSVASILILVSFSLIIYAFVQKDEKDFRQAYWGMSKEQVSKTERLSKLTEQTNSIIYEGEKLGGLFNIQVAYNFGQNNGLVSGMYMYDIPKYNLETALSTYQAFLNILTGQYGNPQKSDSMSSSGQTVGSAKVYSSSWIRNKTKIELILSNIGDENRLFVSYNQIN